MTHQSVVEPMPEHGRRDIETVAKFANRMGDLHHNLDLAQRYDMPDAFLTNQVDQPMHMLTTEALEFQTRNSLARSLLTAIGLFGHLSWVRSPLSAAALGDLARSMKATMVESEVRTCWSLHWTQWQLLLGCVTATDFATRACFRGALIAAWRALEVTSWEDVEILLGKALRPGSGLLMGSMRAIWEEIEVEL
jgi:hypothetical protein